MIRGFTVTNRGLLRLGLGEELAALVPPQLSPVPCHKPPWKICLAAWCSAEEARRNAAEKRGDRDVRKASAEDDG